MKPRSPACLSSITKSNHPLKGPDHWKCALACPKYGYRGTAGGNGPTADVPRPLAHVIDETEQRPGNHDDRELADFHTHIEGKQALPYIR